MENHGEAARGAAVKSEKRKVKSGREAGRGEEGKMRGKSRKF